MNYFSISYKKIDWLISINGQADILIILLEFESWISKKYFRTVAVCPFLSRKLACEIYLISIYSTPDKTRSSVARIDIDYVAVKA